ncbi:hypothetical protein GYA37_00920 [candidate division WWE3 bacterium]|uniref:Uncharacterized protein n=1 Tax=candidate division WWE3 bacterium TaxID=2053526 RepID=A0A7X9E6F9_UNCKA|nr:hypothetical protein [candidate division WWE3 bacterium]
MELHFKISKEILFITGLMQNPDIEGWVDLQNSLWKKYQMGYQLLQGNYQELLLNDNVKNILNQANEDIVGILQDGLESKQFSTLLKNASEHKEWLEKQWKTNKDLIHKEMQNILRIPIPNNNFDVFIFGSLLHIGKNSHNKIFWGQYEHWKNYSLVYLVHEFLHSLFKYSVLEHAIIELISDNEMRLRLNKTGYYFKCNKESVGHKHLQKVEKDILEDWNNYLIGKQIDIYQFLKIMQEKYPQYNKDEDEKY